MEPYLRQFDVEKHEMASVMGICAGLVGPVGPKSENAERLLVFITFLKGSRGARRRQENEKSSEPEHFLVTLGSFFGI